MRRIVRRASWRPEAVLGGTNGTGAAQRRVAGEVVAAAAGWPRVRLRSVSPI